jgi:HemX protein
MADLQLVAQALRIIVPLIYGVVAAGYVAEFYKNRDRHFSWTNYFFIAGIFLHFLLLIVLFLEQNRLPYDTAFRGLLFIAFMASLLFFGMDHFLGEIRYGAFLFPLIFIITGISTAFLNRGLPLPKQLHSFYFVIHATLLFLSYSCFLLSFVISIMYLLQHRQLKSHHLGGLFKRLPSLADMDESVMRVDTLGLGLFILGIATGFLWMEMVIGIPTKISFKIGLASLVLITYLTEHLMRIGKGWNGQRACWISVLGFLFVLVTLLVGRHGY